MALTQYTADTDIIETLGTNPEDRPALTDDTFKAKFDENSENIKVFLNAMIAELASTANGKGASQIGIEDSGSKFTATNVEAALAESATLISTHTAKLVTDVAGVHGLTVESGTFNPTLYGSSTAGTPTYTYRTGRYYKIGKMVHCAILTNISAKGGMVGSIYVGGLPFTAAGYGLTRYSASIGAVGGLSGMGSQNQIGGYLQGAINYISLTVNAYNAVPAQMPDTYLDDTFALQISITYEIA